jgi:hypothetical protein
VLRDTRSERDKYFYLVRLFDGEGIYVKVDYARCFDGAGNTGEA